MRPMPNPIHPSKSFRPVLLTAMRPKEERRTQPKARKLVGEQQGVYRGPRLGGRQAKAREAAPMDNGAATRPTA